MTSNTDAQAARRARHAAIRTEVAQEEAESSEAEVAESAAALDVPLHLRIDRQLDARLRDMAVSEHIPTSALVRRLLRQAAQKPRAELFTAADVEKIARRVAREEMNHS